MRRDRIPTRCLHCNHRADVEEEGYCPHCGAGPAVPSESRVLRLHGEPVTMPTNPAVRDAFWPQTRPASQTIPKDNPRKPGPGMPPPGGEAPGPSRAKTDPEPRRRRRSRGHPDPAGGFWKALDELKRSGTRLTKRAVATNMEISTDALTAYIEEGLIPELPWEGLERGEDGSG